MVLTALFIPWQEDEEQWVLSFFPQPEEEEQPCHVFYPSKGFS